VVVRGRNRRCRGLPPGSAAMASASAASCSVSGSPPSTAPCSVARVPSFPRRKGPTVPAVEAARIKLRTTAAEGDLKNPSSAKSASAEVSGLAPCYFLENFLHITPNPLDQFLVLPALLVQCCSFLCY
jgi:hypothetical protein